VPFLEVRVFLDPEALGPSLILSHIRESTRTIALSSTSVTWISSLNPVKERPVCTPALRLHAARGPSAAMSDILLYSRCRHFFQIQGRDTQLGDIYRVTHLLEIYSLYLSSTPLIPTSYIHLITQ
jgi:hypothetical protein